MVQPTFYTPDWANVALPIEMFSEIVYLQIVTEFSVTQTMSNGFTFSTAGGGFMIMSALFSPSTLSYAARTVQDEAFLPPGVFVMILALVAFLCNFLYTVWVLEHSR